MTMQTGGTYRQFSIGTVLSDTFGAFFGRFGFYLPLAVIAFIPAIVGYIVNPPAGPTAMDRGFDWAQFGTAWVIPLICGSLMAALATYAVVMEAVGRRVTFGETLSVALSRLGALIVASILVGIIIGFFILLAVLGAAAVGFLSLLLIIPGIIAATILWVVVPVVVVERLGPFESLGRSQNLTRGHRWSIFGIIVILVLIGIVVDTILQWVVFPFIRGSGPYVFLAVNLSASIMIQMLQAIAAAYGYFYLKIWKEGAGANELARVFE